MILVYGSNTVFARLTPWFAHSHPITDVNITSYNVISSSSFKNPDEEKGQHWKSWSFGQKSWLQLAPTNLSCISHFRALPCDIMIRLVKCFHCMPCWSLNQTRGGKYWSPQQKYLKLSGVADFLWKYCERVKRVKWRAMSIFATLSLYYLSLPPTHPHRATYCLHPPWRESDVCFCPLCLSQLCLHHLN